MASDWTIRGGRLLDAGGARRADLALSGGRIVRIAPDLPPAEHDLDATGLAVAPGFIDIHCHSELAAFVYPRAESKVLAGVTTDVSGNCGASPFPLAGEFLERRRAEWAPHGLDLDWTTAAGYFARAEAAPSSVNRALLAGHGAIRAAVVGYAGRPATADERAAMRRHVEVAMEAGAFGLSSGLIYPPGAAADVEELADLAAVVARAGGYYTSHIRDEGDRLLEAVEEFLAVLRTSGARGQLSHLKASGVRNWPKAAEAIARLRAARDEGLAVTADRYPYTASMTDLDALVLPNRAFDGGREAELARLRDPATRRVLISEIEAKHPEPDYADRILIAAVGPDGGADGGGPDPSGMRLAAYAREVGRPPLEAAFDLIVARDAQVTATYFSMSEKNLRRLLAEPFVAVGSDAGLRDLPEPGSVPRGRPHPRAYGTAGRFLGTYVRDEGLMDWPEAIRRLTALPAEVLGLAGRGWLAERAWADLVVFDPARIADRATYDVPWATPAGIEHVFVNGERVVAAGAHTGATPGRVLRRTAP